MGAVALATSMAMAEGPALRRDMFTDFIEYLDASPKTIETYTRAIRQFIKWLQAEGINRPARADVIRYRDGLKETKRPTTVTNYLNAVKLFFRWTSDNGIYPNVADHIKGARLDRSHKKDALTATQAGDVLEDVDTTTAKGKRDYAILALMVTCGLRTVEVIRADVGDLRTVSGKTVIYIQGKGHEEKSDFIEVIPETEKALRAYFKTRKTLEAGEPLFTSDSNRNAGGRMTTRSISRIAKNHLIEAGYNSSRLTAHSLRHTAVSIAMAKGETLEECRKFARHASMNTTLIYAHELDESRNTCAETIGAAIFRR